MAEAVTIAAPRRLGPRAETWRPLFLQALRTLGNVRAACQAAGIDRMCAYRARAQSTEFHQEWDSALEDAIDSMEAEAYRRAVVGVDEPVYYLGQPIGAIRKYSDALLINLLKAYRPEKYREKQWPLEGAAPGVKRRVEIIMIRAEEVPVGDSVFDD